MAMSKQQELVIFETFPREVGRMKMWCPDYTTYLNFLKENNGVSQCFCSVLKQTLRRSHKPFGSADPVGALVDKIYLDLDNKYGYESMVILHEALQDANILHRINFSGRHVDGRAVGFHFYIFTHPNMTHKKGAVKNFQKHLELKLRAKLSSDWGVEFVKLNRNNPIPDYELPQDQMYEIIDQQIMGDLIRISRITDTWNTKRKRFCIPLDEVLIYQGAEAIYEAAYRPQMENITDVWFGEKIYQLPEKFDKEPYHARTYISEMEIEPNYDILENIEFPYCIRKLMNNPFLDYERRFWLLKAFRDSGILKRESYDSFSQILHPDWFRHMIEPSPGEDMIERVYDGPQSRAYIPVCEEWRDMAGLTRAECANCPKFRKNHPIYW